MDKTKFLFNTAGLDSEGFKVEHPNLEEDRRINGELLKVLAHDHPLRATIEQYMANPMGWQEVDGVKLPSVATWAEQGTLPTLTGWSDEALDAGLAVWKAEGVRIVGERRKVQR